jgi:TolB-like protein/DNA-binding SARP family transcriptional activator/Tfp pilus assembly protein PilF
MFSLRLLGGASIEGPDGPLTGRAAQRHRLALLALLAVRPRGVTRDKLVAYLWPERGADRARHALSDSVYRINTALEKEAVVAAGDELRLEPQELPSDVGAFREGLEAEDWERAVDAYGGPFLDGFHLRGAAEFERWVDGERERLARRWADALESLAEERRARGDLTGAVEAWRRRAAHDRYDSRVTVRLMEALEAAGNRAGALKHARIHAQLLEQEFGTDPDPEVLELAERLRDAPAAGENGGPEGVDDGHSTPSPEPGEASDAAPVDRADPYARGEPGPQRSAAGAGPPVPSGRGRSSPGGPEGAGPIRRRARLRRAATVGLAVLLAATGGWLAWETAAGGGGPPTPSTSVAVLPFEDLSTGEEDRFFADGVTEDILTNLSRIGDLRVTARASVLPYRETDKRVSEIAEELDVEYVLEGSVRRLGDRVRITAQLIDGETNAHAWAENYDRSLSDVFAVQTDIARRVADALEAELAPTVAARIEREPTDDLEAYNLYLRGRYDWHRRTEEGLRASVRYFERAVERDSTFAGAWAGLADAYAVLAFYDYLPPRTAYPRAKEAVTRALEIDETLAEAHASLGYITLYHGWDAARAEAEFRRAIELNPSYSVGHQWYANLLVATGRFDEAEREMSRAREVNPQSLIANGALGWVHYYAGRYHEAVAQCDRALQMDPDWDLGHLWRGLALVEMGRTEEALRSLERAVELSEGSGITVAGLAHARAVAGRVESARDLLADLVRAGRQGAYMPSFEIAKVHVALGEPGEALDWLERALDERSHSMVFLEVDPQLAPLRSEPRFRQLVRRVGLEG